MYKLKLLHTNGAVRYQGWTKKKPRNDRQIDECGLLLPYFEGLVYEYDQDRNFIQCFCIKSGKRQPKQIVENENFEFHHGFPSKSFYYTGQKDPLGKNCGFGIQYNYDEHDNIKIHFIGRFENGKRCGSGKLFDEDGTMIFEGNWKNDKPHGFGKKFHPNGTLFLEAEWWKGNPSSNCSIYSPYGALRFQGKWKDYQGPGITYCNWTGHCLYQGYFKDGMGNGEGIATESTYYSHFTHGNFCNGKAEGEVEMYVSYQDITSISFRGNMKNGEKDGFGISLEHGEIEYWGFFKNDLHHGFGIEFKMGYLPSWTPQAKFNTPDMFDKRFIEFQGVYHEDDKIEGKTFYNNGNIRYDGTFETREYNLEHYNDLGIIGPYFFSSHNEHYHGFGKLYYPSGALCYDGEWYYNLQLGKGTFYSEDGKQKIENEFIDGAWYGHGIYYLSCKTGEEIFYSGSLKNGLPHGEGIIFEYDLSECHRDEPPKINSVYSGAFFEGNYYHKVKHTNGFLYNFFHTIVFSGDYQDGTFVNGIQFEHECLHRYIKEPKIEQIIWKNGKIFDQNKERYEARQRHYISSYLETKEKYWIKHVPRWICLSMHKEILGCEKKNNPKCSKLSILDEIIQFQKKKASSLEENNDGCDLFGNEICHPVKGYDGLTYDIKSLIHLFSVKENGDYTMISYSYDSNNEQTPIFPNTGTTNQLKGFYMVEEDTRLLVDFKIVPITNWENGTFFCNKVKKLPSGELMFSNTDLDKKLKDFEIRFRSLLRFDHRAASRLREEIQGST